MYMGYSGSFSAAKPAVHKPNSNLTMVTNWSSAAVGVPEWLMTMRRAALSQSRAVSKMPCSDWMLRAPQKASHSSSIPWHRENVDTEHMEALELCLDGEGRSWVVDDVYPGLPPAHIVPRRPLQASRVKTGRWGRVLLRTNVAVKVQKVFCSHGRLKHVEWRGGTSVALDIFQELVAAKYFGKLGVAPAVSGIYISKELPEWVDGDSHADFQGQVIKPRHVWNLIMVMDRLHGTLREVLAMTPRSSFAFWQKADLKRLGSVVRTLIDNHYEHCDVRLDNVGYKIRKNGTIKFYAFDFGYGKILDDPRLAHRVKKKFGKVLLAANAPHPLVRQMNTALAVPAAMSTLL